MIRTVVVVTLLMIAASALESQEVAGRGNTSMSIAETQASNKRVVTELFEQCFNHGDLERLPAIVAEEYQGPNGQKGPGAFAATITQIRATLTGLRYGVDDVVAEGDRVAVRWHLTGKQDGPFRGFAASHNNVDNVGMAIFTLEGGKIVRAALLTDQLGFLQQIGVLPREIKPPATPQPASSAAP
jgi:predicted ester cyclase